MDYVALKNEILIDPKTMGYAGKNDQQISDLLNTVPSVPTTTYRGLIGAYEIINNTVPSEFSVLTSAEQNRYLAITGAGQVDTSNANVRSAFAQMFGSGTTTRTNLSAMAIRNKYRWEEIVGIDKAPTHIDVAIALRG